MPRHLISDAHEWINEIPTVPIYYLAKPQPRERAWQNQRGKKTLRYYSTGASSENSLLAGKMSGMVNFSTGEKYHGDLLGRLNAWKDIAGSSQFRYMLVI